MLGISFHRVSENVTMPSYFGTTCGDIRVAMRRQ
jgi:hypothetical protein